MTNFNRLLDKLPASARVKIDERFEQLRREYMKLLPTTKFNIQVSREELELIQLLLYNVNVGRSGPTNTLYKMLEDLDSILGTNDELSLSQLNRLEFLTGQDRISRDDELSIVIDYKDK
jgi:hypothetical protein